MKIFFTIFAIVVTISQSTIAQEKHHKWQRLSGKWEATNSTVTETKGNSIKWDYYEILNHNTILTLDSLSNYNSLDSNVKIFDREDSPSEIMISFAVTSESQSWFYHMYAFKLTGGFWGMNKVSLVYSDRLDKTKPFATKNNIFIKELASADCKVKYNTNYNYRIAFEGTDIVFYINGKKTLSSPFPEKSHDGRIAISSRNIKISVDKVEVKQNDKIIFEDDFNVDSIYVKTLKAQKVPVTNGETEKKPE